MSTRTRSGLFIFLIISLVAIWLHYKHIEINSLTRAAQTLDPAISQVRGELAPSKKIPAGTDLTGVRVAQAGGSLASKPSQISPETALCKIMNANIQVPLGGKLKVWTYAYEVDEEGQPGFVSLVQSSECPNGLFSRIRMDQLGRIKELIDCRTSTKEEIFSRSGIQGNVEDHPSSGNKLNLAISGDGYFVKECQDRTFLTRSGELQWDGRYVSHGGCAILAKDGGHFTWDGSELDEKGCTVNGSCIALVKVDPSTVSYSDRLTFQSHEDPIIRPTVDSHIFHDALETFDDPDTGPTGPDWAARSEVQLPKSCSAVL